MAHSEDHIALAAEYALGTLDADERAQVETMMAVDAEYTAICCLGIRLGVLTVSLRQPRPIVWETSRPHRHSPNSSGAVIARGAPPPSPPPSCGRPVAAPWGRGARPPRTFELLRAIGKRWRNLASVPALARLCRDVALQVYQPHCCRRAAAEAAHPTVESRRRRQRLCPGAICPPAAA